MLKLTAVVSLMLIGNSLWAAGISCDSCGSECASACGTRHFRSCCFNYLRRKRGPEVGFKFWPQPLHDRKEVHSPSQTQQAPLVIVENMPNFPETWLTNLPTSYKSVQQQPNSLSNLSPKPLQQPNWLPNLQSEKSFQQAIEDPLDNRVQILYD